MIVIKAANEMERMELQERHASEVSEPVVFGDKVGKINEYDFWVPVTKKNGNTFCLNVHIDKKVNSYLDFAQAKWHIYSAFYVGHNKEQT